MWDMIKKCCINHWGITVHALAQHIQQPAFPEALQMFLYLHDHPNMENLPKTLLPFNKCIHVHLQHTIHPAMDVVLVVLFEKPYALPLPIMVDYVAILSLYQLTWKFKIKGSRE